MAAAPARPARLSLLPGAVNLTTIMSDEFNARRLQMASDELLDAHRKRLEDDPGYREVWEKTRAMPAELQLLTAMRIWSSQATVLRSLCGAYALAADGAPIEMQCPNCRQVVPFTRSTE